MDRVNPIMDRLITLLGLKEDASEDDIMAAIEGMMSSSMRLDARQFVPTQMFNEVLTERNAAQEALHANLVMNKVAQAEDDGHFTSQPMREWATKLCTQDMDAFDQFLATSNAPYAHLTEGFRKQRFQAVPIGRDTPGVFDTSGSEATSVCAQRGLPEGSLDTAL